MCGSCSTTISPLIRIFLLLILLAAGGGFSDAQEGGSAETKGAAESEGDLKVLVAPLHIASDKDILSRVGKTVEDNIRLLLPLIGNYRTISLSDISTRDEFDGEGEPGRERLYELSVEHSIDNIVFGDLSTSGEGALEFTLHVYAGGDDRISLSVSESTSSLLEVFDLSDKITLRLIEGFSDTPLSFGSIVFVNSGHRGEYELIFDGKRVGANVRVLPHVPAGSHSIELQWHAGGEIYTVFEDNVKVREGAEQSVDFAIPSLPEPVFESFYSLDREIVDALEASPEDPSAESLLSRGVREAEMLSSEFPGSEHLRDKYRRWEDRYRESRDKSFSAGSTAGSENGSVPLELPPPDFSIKEFAGGVSLSSRLSFNKREEEPKKVQNNVAHVTLPSARSIRVDGDASDWEGIEAAARDLTDAVDPSADIRKMYIAADDTYLYAMVEFEGRPSLRPNWVDYGFSVMTYDTGGREGISRIGLDENTDNNMRRYQMQILDDEGVHYEDAGRNHVGSGEVLEFAVPHKGLKSSYVVVNMISAHNRAHKQLDGIDCSYVLVRTPEVLYGAPEIFEPPQR